MKEWWRRRPLRFRLALWYAVGSTVLLAGFSEAIYLYVRERMARPLAAELRGDLDEVKRRMQVSPEGTVRWDGQVLTDRVTETVDYPWFELWDENGALVRRMWPFAEDGEGGNESSAPYRERETLSIFYVADDMRLRVFSVPFVVEGRADKWMVRVIRYHEPAAEALGALRVIIFFALPVVVALLVVGGYVITRRWLMPLEDMATEANHISVDDLSRRLPVVNPHDELGRLATVFNVTLDRLQGSFDALDRFVADASHELRTPLTTLRSVGEVGLRRGRTVAEYQEIIASMLEEAQRLQVLIHRLLELASAEGGGPDVHRSSIRVDDHAIACVNELSILTEAKRQRIEVESEPCTVLTDPVLFRQALQNLVDNAIKYSPEDAVIRVRVRELSDHVEVSVSDEGPGISPQHRSQLMERFFRTDRARDRNSGGFGLGLSITKAYMRALGGTLRYEPGEAKGSVFSLVLPKSRAG